MGKFLDALKNIGAKVNGKTPTSTTTVAVLNEIANDYQGGGGGTQLYLYNIVVDIERYMQGGAVKNATAYATVISTNDYDVESEEADLDTVLFNLVSEQSTDDNGKFITATSITQDLDYTVVGFKYYSSSGDEGIQPIYVKDGENDAVITVTYIYKKVL